MFMLSGKRDGHFVDNVSSGAEESFTWNKCYFTTLLTLNHKTLIVNSVSKMFVIYFTHCQEDPNGRICTKFGPGGRLTDAINCFKYFVDR